jgi:hypothetical protein
MSDFEITILKIAIYSAMIVILVTIAIDLIKNDREISKRISKHKKQK